MGMDFTGIGSVADFAKGLVDRFFPPDLPPAEKAQKELELQALLQNRENTIIAAQKEVMVAEMQQGDLFTKRARPTIVYAGLAFIFLVHVFLPLAAFFKGVPADAFPKMALPDDFWWTWGGVCSVWVLGRTMERRGATGTVLSAITGSGKTK
jgi:hypothetical protein